MGRVLQVFERQLLLFPILVVLLASVTFLFGGSCAAWQWWASVGAVLCAPFCVVSRKDALRAGGLFALTLVLFWLLAGVIMTVGGHDMNIYHLPAIRLLAEGWNPITAPTPETIQATFGIDPTTFHQWHVISMPKAVWYFSAVAGKFTGEPFSLSLMVWLFLFVASAWRTWHFFENSPQWFRALAVMILLVTGESFTAPVDAVVGFAGVALVLTMVECLRYRKWQWIYLLGFSFWMCTAKHLGMAACFIFWLAFAVAALVMRLPGGWRRLTISAAVLAVTTLLVGFSPFVTSWRAFGHPLYPAASGDPAKHPVINLTADFHERNDDARAMGHVGHFVNAFVSKSVAHAYYRMKLGKPDFFPEVGNWGQCGAGREKGGSPTPAHFRLVFCLACLLIFWRGDVPARVGAGAIVAALFCFPTEMIGYVRYSPWLNVLYLLALERLVPRGEVLGTERLVHAKLVKAGIGLFGLYFAGVYGVPAVATTAYYIDAMAGAKGVIADSHIKNLYRLEAAEQHTNGCRRCKFANLELLQRSCKALGSASIVPIPNADEKDLSVKYELFFDNSFWLRREDVHLEEYSAYKALKKSAGGGLEKRMMKIPIFVMKAYCSILPRLVWQRVSGR